MTQLQNSEATAASTTSYIKNAEIGIAIVLGIWALFHGLMFYIVGKYGSGVLSEIAEFCDDDGKCNLVLFFFIYIYQE